MESVVITGVSSGIGLGTARVLIKRGFRVFGTVRRAVDGERVARELGSNFSALCCDVTDEASMRRAAEEVRAALAGRTLAGLVNNAGIVVPAPVLSQSRADFEAQLQVNLVGLFTATRAFLPLLGTERGRTGRPGRILNVSSVGGKIASPFIAAYAASKHGVEGFSESLRRELLLFGIDVIIIGPGSTATPIWEKGESASQAALLDPEYAGALRAFNRFALSLAQSGYPPERVGEVIAVALTARKPRVRYAVVPGRLWNWTLPRLLPRRLVDRALARQLRLGPEERPAADTGRICLVTGATAGIGRAIALGLARRGDSVIIIGQDITRARAAADEITLSTGNPRVIPLAADLSSMGAVRDLVRELRQRVQRLDVLVNNAAAIFTERQLTAEGIERTFALNHLAPFSLTLQLLPLLQATAGARIVNVSADPKMLARIGFPADDLQGERSYSGITAYMATKLMNVLFTYELARRLTGVTVNAMHPGVVQTRLDRDLRGPLKWLLSVARPLLRTPERAARTALMLACDPGLAGVSGQFFLDERPARSSPITYDEKVAARLWADSEQLLARAASSPST